MIITFFGHSNCLFNDDIKKQLKNILVDEINKNPISKFYLGGYGDFDGLCLKTLRELKHDFPTIEILFSVLLKFVNTNYQNHHTHLSKTYRWGFLLSRQREYF